MDFFSYKSTISNDEWIHIHILYTKISLNYDLMNIIWCLNWTVTKPDLSNNGKAIKRVRKSSKQNWKDFCCNFLELFNVSVKRRYIYNEIFPWNETDFWMHAAHQWIFPSVSCHMLWKHLVSIVETTKMSEYYDSC